MFYDAASFPNGIHLSDYDVCIVGGGAAGIAMGVQLDGSPLRVLILESGLEDDRGRPSPVRESIYGGKVGTFLDKVDPTFLTRSRLRMFGGTTNHFHFWARPLDPDDLKPRPGYRESSWAIGYDDLAPHYYSLANEYGGFGPFNYDDISYWAGVLSGKPFDPLPGDRLRNAIFHAQEDVSIHDFQLRWKSKLKASKNVYVVFNANALEVLSTPDKQQVTGITFSAILDQKPFKRFTALAKKYVLTQGGVEIVRLLKLSGDLGDNARGLLGKGFMVHPVIGAAAKLSFKSPVDRLIQNFFAYQTVWIDAKDPNEPVREPIYHPEDLEELYTFQAWGVLSPTPLAMKELAIGNFRIVLGFGSSGSRCGININWEQVPNDNSTITLAPDERDPVFQQPVVKVDWNLEEKDKKTIVEGLRLVQEYLEARGGSDFEIITDLSGGAEHWTFGYRTNPSGLNPGDHHMGAFRMSDSPANGIVDKNLRVHTVSNLYLASSGAFPTSGYANPTLTIVALALRLADHLKSKPS